MFQNHGAWERHLSTMERKAQKTTGHEHVTSPILWTNTMATCLHDLTFFVKQQNTSIALEMH